MTVQLPAMFEEALALGEAIRQVAKEGDFEQVLRLLQERQAMLEEAFSFGVPTEVVPHLRARLDELRQDDEALLALIEEARTALRENLRTLDLERRAQVAYGRV